MREASVGPHTRFHLFCTYLMSPSEMDSANAGTFTVTSDHILLEMWKYCRSSDSHAEGQSESSWQLWKSAVGKRGCRCNGLCGCWWCCIRIPSMPSSFEWWQTRRYNWDLNGLTNGRAASMCLPYAFAWPRDKQMKRLAADASKRSTWCFSIPVLKWDCCIKNSNKIYLKLWA